MHKSVSTAKQQPLKEFEGNLQSELAMVQSSNKAIASLSQQLQQKVEIQQSLLDGVTSILNSYSQLNDIKLDSLTSTTEILPSKALEQSKILQDVCAFKCIAGFDAALAKINNINFQDGEGKTILTHAIINEFHYGVEKLLLKDADVNIIDNKGANSLIYSAAFPHIKYTKLIAERTLNINQRAHGFDNKTALHVLVNNATNKIYYSEFKDWLGEESQEIIFSGNLIIDESCTITKNIKFASPSHGYTIEQGRALRLIKLLVNKGASLCAQDDKGLTPFFYACAHKLKYISDKVIDIYGIKPETKDNAGYGAMHWAMEFEDPDILQKVLNNGADINACDNKGLTTLFWAVLKNWPNIVSWLAKHNADLNIASYEGITPLHQSIILKNMPMSKMLVVLGADISKPTNQGYFPWHYAAIHGALDIMQFLKSKISNIDIKTADNKEITALWLAASQGHIDVVKWLADEGADLNASDISTGLPVTYIAMAQKHKIVGEELLNRAANINIVDSAGYNSLHWVLELKDLTLVEKVITRGINVNHQDNEGCTALFWAAKYLLTDIVELLYNKYNAQDLPSKQGYTAWDLATLNLNQDLINILAPKKKVSLEAVTLWCAARKGDQNIVEQQLKKGVDPDTTIANSKETTPLIEAVISGDLKVITNLVANNAKINKPDNELASPLYYSLGYGGQAINPAIVKFLVSKGADITQSMIDGDTPLHMACYKACLGAIKFLIEKGAEVDKVNKAGKTPLHSLIEKKDIPQEQKLTSIKYLLSNSIHDNKGNDAAYLAKYNSPETSELFANSETLERLSIFEASIIGELSAWE